ncbi:unnamed protein product [Chironomus riparius]|uniref:Gustatory receptor n=1 Tax=Chironomus riparius TaxID=315576 RepID=A0A9N9SBH5_9DIPT|nr:unnamed protein product [Chironomus riparius]
MLSEVYSSLRPLFILSSMTGLFFFKIDYKTSSIVTSIWNKITILATFIIYIIGCWFYLKSELISKLFSTKLSKISSNILIGIDCAFIIVAMMWTLIKRGKILQMLIKLSEIDDNLCEAGLKINYKSLKNKLIALIGFILLFLISQVGITMVISIHLMKFQLIGVIICIYNYLIFIIGIVLVSQYAVYMYNIGTRFEMMNLCIENSLRNTPKTHLKIAECVNIYNSIYGLPMMGTFAIFLIWYIIASSKLVLAPEINMFSTIALTFNISTTAIALCFTIFAAEKILIAKQKSIHLLYSKLDKEPGKSDKIINLIMQIRHTNVGFSCKFFEFNWSLMFKFASACVMYLVILIQFEGGM